VLIADPDAVFIKALSSHLQGLPGVTVEGVKSLAEVEPRIASKTTDLIFLSTELKEALATVEEIKRGRPEIEVVLTAVTSRMEHAVKAMKAGASDYVQKPLRPEQVAVALERARRMRRLSDENRSLRAQLQERYATRTLIGSTPEAQRMQDQIARAAQSQTAVLFIGEPGTGKELAARTVHLESARGARPFLTIDCRGTRPELLEQEIVSTLERAQGGTVLLKEVAELPLPQQAPVARAMIERVVRPPGSVADVVVDARVMASTTLNLLELVGRGTFRQDLFERLSAQTIALPPLRERIDDIPLLADGFLKRRMSSGKRAPRNVSAEALATLLSHDWPGNVRELEQAIDRASELGESDVLERRHLPPSVIQASEARRKTGAAEVTTRSLREMESEVIEKLLSEHRGDTEVVSKLLKIDRSTLYRKIKRYQIPLDDLKE